MGRNALVLPSRCILSPHEKSIPGWCFLANCVYKWTILYIYSMCFDVVFILSAFPPQICSEIDLVQRGLGHNYSK